MSGGTGTPAGATLEPPGAKVKIEGLVRELFDDGTAFVDFPCPGGGSLGVRLVPAAPVKVGDRYDATATVTKADANAVTLTVECYDKGALQTLDLERSLSKVTPA